MSFYPDKINRRFDSPKYIGHVTDADTVGTGASFLCGVSIKFYLRIESETKEICEARYKTNGCGYVIATADFLAEKLIGQKLTEMHGLGYIENAHKIEFGDFPGQRKHCSDICLDALSAALGEYRESQVVEWTGEKALICSCFGVAEETIEKKISDYKLKSVGQVGEVCNAGTGCGSCQHLIQEILDCEIELVHR